MGTKYNILILLAACKGNLFIREQLDSILNQDCNNWHLIVSDDGTDTQQILQEYADKYPDKITHYKSGKIFGTAQGHFMHLLKNFHNAKYIMFSDQDDVWHSDKVRVTFDKMAKCEAEYGSDFPLLVFTEQRFVDKNLKLLASTLEEYSGIPRVNAPAELSFKKLFLDNKVAGCTMMINSALVKTVISTLDNTEFKYFFHDHYIAMLASLVGKCVYLGISTMDYRLHEDNVTMKTKKEHRSVSARLHKFFFEGFKGYLPWSQRAEYIKSCFGEYLSSEDKSFLQELSDLCIMNRFQRAHIYLKYGFVRSKFSILGKLIKW